MSKFDLLSQFLPQLHDLKLLQFLIRSCVRTHMDTHSQSTHKHPLSLSLSLSLFPSLSCAVLQKHTLAHITKTSVISLFHYPSLSLSLTLTLCLPRTLKILLQTFPHFCFSDVIARISFQVPLSRPHWQQLDLVTHVILGGSGGGAGGRATVFCSGFKA